MRYGLVEAEGSAIARVTNTRYEITDVNRIGLPTAEHLMHLISGAAAGLSRLWWGDGGILGARVR